MDISFENHAYNKLLEKTGLLRGGTNGQIIKVLIPLVVCWLPLAILTLFYQTFWTGNVATSFITNFDTQTRLLIALPVFIIAEKWVSEKVGLILVQFVNSGIIRKEELDKFYEIIQSNMQFLKSNWTDFAVIAICYAHVFVLQYSELYTHTSLISWQLIPDSEESVMNLAGWWNLLISKPFIMFLFYRWLLRIVVYGRVLYKISFLNLNLYAAHSDLMGGIGFIAYTMSYFSPVAFGISASVAGKMADQILIEGHHLVDLKLEIIAFVVFVTILFTVPLLSFVKKLVRAREKSIFENYDMTNGLYREFGTKWAKGFDEIKPEDISQPDFSTITDMSSVMKNMLDMKTFPFRLKDMFLLWIMTGLPFLPVIALEIPLWEAFTRLMQILP